METMADVNAVSTSGQSHQPPELRIVLIGGRELTGSSSNKSASGNIILGHSVFETNRRTAESVVRQQEVHGRQVTVVDTPGWWWHYPRENTPQLDQMEIKYSVHLCPPGPHTFLLVIPVGLIFPEIFKQSLEEHLQLFHEGVFQRTIVLFTVDYPFSEKSLEYEISEWPALQRLLQQCGNRKHLLNISNREDSTQVIKLFKKIEALVAKNGGSHYSIDSAEGNALREKMATMVERASKRFAEVQTKRRELKALIEGGKTPPTHLRIVMVGAQWSAKSSAGNTILRKKAFAVSHRRTTEFCEISHNTVVRRQLTVVDSPGWYYNNTLQDMCEMDKLEIENSMHLCPPGPHAVLLVVGLSSAFNASYLRAVREHMSLFTDEVWKHTVVLFTRGDWLGVKTVEERIESEKDLQWLVERCGNMYHVLDNTNRCDDTQVTELLEKIEEMWAGNKDPHYESDLGRAEQMEARKEAEGNVAKRIRQTAQRQERILKELFRGERQPITDMRVVLVGRKESGKSMVGNRILFDDLFDSAWMKKEFQGQRGNTVCVKHERNAYGVNISVVETPGWFADEMISDRLKSEVLRSISMCAPGPHAFLLVVPISKPFTENEYRAMLELLMPFGERVWRHCMVLFTWADWLNNRSIEEHITTEGKALQRLVEKCGYRYHTLSGSRFGYGFPAMEVFQKMTDMITRNKGHHFGAENKLGKKQKPTLTWQEWNRREQELIDRMLKALAQEPEEPTVPSMKMTASFDGAFIPSMSGDVHSEVGSTYCNHRAHARVAEWLSLRVGNSDVTFGNSDVTSGVDSMSASASHVEKMDEGLLTDDNHHPVATFFPEKDKMKFDAVRIGGVHTVETQRRHSF
ncbi:GTPase IMAP family member 8-like isoform X2 [Sebastes umbrosus]|uniref:GTPase IMAP family member 8-like isoform X2 n=1 Tax=Sebastes umbrosus TaxID=72105 RepID=UPI0018A0A60E|nr:GTPase IMAP family member 8-like isoform X2 [Sebastes umbrosus]